MCAALGRLMTDDGHWERASRRVSSHFAERHSLAAVVGMYEREFERLAAGTGLTPA
jgi:hypothetical protein